MQHPTRDRIATALGSSDDKVRAFRMGADDFLQKPTPFAQIKERIELAFERRERMMDALRACRALWSRVFTAPALIPMRPAVSSVSRSSMSRSNRTLR